MSAYAHYQRGQEHFELAAKRAAQRARELAEQLNQRLRFRLGEHGPAVRLQTARQLLDSAHPAHQAAGRTIYASAQRELRLEVPVVTASIASLAELLQGVCGRRLRKPGVTAAGALGQGADRCLCRGSKTGVIAEGGRV